MISHLRRSSLYHRMTGASLLLLVENLCRRPDISWFGAPEVNENEKPDQFIPLSFRGPFDVVGTC